MNEIKKYALTGGPCAGKTTSLVYVVEKLRDFGYTAFTVPEAATELFSNGVQIGDHGISLADFQEQHVRKQIEQENRYMEIARHHRGDKKVVICDRGAMDGCAYIDPVIFEQIVSRIGYTIPEIRDARYDAVFHLVTAADGAEAFYSLANNGARWESADEARQKDKKTQEVWLGHPHLRVIDNSTDFEGKKLRLLQKICHAIGIPAPLEIEHKYLLSGPNDIGFVLRSQGIPYAKISIEQTYLTTSTTGEVRRIRRRAQNGAGIYYYEEKKVIRSGVRIEIGKVISEHEYSILSADQADDARDTVKKDRYCFLWRNQYFELDCLHEPTRHKGELFLEIELTDENDTIELPGFFAIDREVTDEPEFSNYALAQKH